MTYDELSPAMRAFLGAFSAFRNLGFSSDHIFAYVCPSASPGNPLAAFCVLRPPGELEFSCECGPVESGDAFMAEYARLAREPLSDEDGDRVWRESGPHRHPLDFVAAILAKGIDLPPPAPGPDRSAN